MPGREICPKFKVFQLFLNSPKFQFIGLIPKKNVSKKFSSLDLAFGLIVKKAVMEIATENC